MLSTPRLHLVPATIPAIQAALDAVELLAVVLDVEIPVSWPPMLLDDAALEWTLQWLRTPGVEPSFGLYWIILTATGGQKGTLVGVAGFKGMPRDGAVEIGYGVLPEFQRRGIATEAVRVLLVHAWTRPDVQRVVAETYPHLTPSIGVLEKCGFSLVGDGSEPGVVRYGIERPSRRLTTYVPTRSLRDMQIRSNVARNNRNSARRSG